MARPTSPTSLRLQQIDPADLGRQCAEAVAAHVGRLAVPMSPGYTVHVSGPNGDTGLAFTVSDLARYARGEGELESVVEDYAVELMLLLCSPLASGTGAFPPVLAGWLSGEVDVDDLDPESLEDRLALVLTAALGREALAGGSPLTVAQLAALGGTSPDAVRRLVRDGELAAASEERPMRVGAADARRWLATRWGK